MDVTLLFVFEDGYCCRKYSNRTIKNVIERIRKGLVQIVPVLISAYVHKLYVVLDSIGHPILYKLSTFQLLRILCFYTLSAG